MITNGQESALLLHGYLVGLFDRERAKGGVPLLVEKLDVVEDIVHGTPVAIFTMKSGARLRMTVEMIE